MSVAFTGSQRLTSGVGAADLTSGTGLTLSLYYYTTNDGSSYIYETLVSIDSASPSETLGLGRFDASINFFGAGLDWYNGSVSPNVWHHVAVVREAGETPYVKLFLDGALIKDGTGAEPAASARASVVTIGADYGGGEEFGTGSLENVIVIPKALTDVEIQTLARRQFPGALAPLSCWYPLRAGSDRVYDYSGAGNNLTPSGSPTDGVVSGVAW